MLPGRKIRAASLRSVLNVRFGLLCRAGNVNVRFRPTATGLRSGALIVTSALAGSGAVALTGTGNGAVAAATPASNNFGGITRGQVSAPFSFTVTNNGTSVLTFTCYGCLHTRRCECRSVCPDDRWLVRERRVAGAPGELHVLGNFPAEDRHRSRNENCDCQSSEQCHERRTNGERGRVLGPYPGSVAGAPPMPVASRSPV